MIPIGTWEKFVVGTPTQIVITYGPDVDHVINKARENQIGLLVVNARFFKPIDEVMMKDLLKLNLPITVYETDIKKGGLSSAILEYMNTLDEKIHVLAIGDHYVCHGSIRSLRIQEGISTECLFEELEKMDKIRLDKALLNQISSRAKAQDMIKEGKISVNGKVITKASF